MAETATAAADRITGARTPAPRRFTVDEYYRMAKAGIFGPDERVELLDGEVMTMAPIGSRHAACVRSFAEWFIVRLAGRAIVSIQSPIRLDDGSEPEPDVALLRPRADRYAQRHPAPSDVLLVIEVSDTTLPFDRDVKLPLYARAGIPELWSVDLNAQRLRVYRGPTDGEYEQMLTAGPQASISPLAFPDLVLPVGEILPPEV